jgi:hypothetical protein
MVNIPCKSPLKRENPLSAKLNGFSVGTKGGRYFLYPMRTCGDCPPIGGTKIGISESPTLGGKTSASFSYVHLINA